MTSTAQKKASRLYDMHNTKQIKLKLNLGTDSDIIRWLESQENKQGYIKQLIRADMHVRHEVDS